MHDTLPLLRATDFPPRRRRGLTTSQVNLGYRCNQSCLHCQVDAGPKRTEQPRVGLHRGNGQHRYTYKSIKGNLTKDAYLVQDEPRHIR